METGIQNTVLSLAVDPQDQHSVVGTMVHAGLIDMYARLSPPIAAPLDEHRPPRIEAMRERNREWLSRHQAEVKQLAAALRRDVAKGHVGAWH